MALSAYSRVIPLDVATIRSQFSDIVPVQQAAWQSNRKHQRHPAPFQLSPLYQPLYSSACIQNNTSPASSLEGIDLMEDG